MDKTKSALRSGGREPIPSDAQKENVFGGGSEASRPRNGTMGQETHTNGGVGRNGNSNGASSHALREFSFPGLPGATFRESEYIRIIEQALYSLGYDGVAESLERQSGVELQSTSVRNFRSGALSGNWDEVLRLLNSVGIKDEEGFRKAKFLVLEQKYLEILQAGDIQGALECLREELTPLQINTKRLHELASLMRCKSLADLHESDSGVPSGVASRATLLTKLQEVIPASMMIPECRLETLLGQAICNQVDKCMYYNKTDTTFSLLADYDCGPEQIPSETVQILDAHSDEVWHIQFSYSGKYLASASADGCAIVWERDAGGKFFVKHELLGHTKQIAFVSWSPNDRFLLTCGNDNVLNLWDVDSGESVHSYSKHVDSVTSCAWFPDSARFVSGGIDKHIYMWSIHGEDPVRHWKGSRINDLAVSHSGKWMVSTSNEKKFQIYDLSRDCEEFVAESESIISLCLAKQSDLLLVNLQNQKIHLWDLNKYSETGELPTEPAHRYRSQNEKQGRYVIRSCFGGSNQTFIVSGSEDSQVYIWHQAKGELLKVLSGHSGTVNAVSWSPVDPYTFASASDDCSVRIWGVGRGD